MTTRFLACFALLILAPLAAADQSAPANGSTSTLKNYDQSLYEQLSNDADSLYAQLGGRAVIERIVDDGVNNLVADVRIGHLFKETDLPNLKLLLTEQICQLSGGPCQYSGRSMQESHAGMQLRESDFIALVEDFQLAMRKNGIAFEQENKLLALLAPMKRAVIHQ